MHYSEDTTLTISVIDCLVKVLRSWKKIIVITLIITVLSACFGAFGVWTKEKKKIEEEEEMGLLRENPEQITEIREEKIVDARSKLTVAEAEEVERLIAQLNSYVDYRRMLQEDFSSYASFYTDDAGDAVLKRTSYILKSSMEGAENLFVSSALGIDDFKEMKHYLPEDMTLADVYNQITISSISGNETTLSNMGESSSVIQSQYLIKVDIVGDSRNTCDKLANVIDDAFERELKVLKKVDEMAKLEVVETNYMGNLNEYIVSKQQPKFDQIQKIDTTISNLLNNYIKKLTKNQISYYNLMKDPEKGIPIKLLATNEEPESDDLTDEMAMADMEEEITKPQYVKTKNIIMGILLGFLFACMLVLVPYILDGTIKMGSEMEEYYRISVLDMFFIEGNTTGPFTNLIKILLKADTASLKSKSATVAVDICGIMESNKAGSLYLIQTCNNSEDNMIADLIDSAVSENDQTYQVFHGLPLEDVNEMKKMTKQKNALVLVHTKKTLKSDVEKILSYCGRHDISVLGAVAIENV